MAIAINSTRIHHTHATNTAQYRRVSHTILTDTILTLRGIALCSLKFFIYGPRCLCDNSQLYSLAELRMYRAADSKRNGVVGSTGRNIPDTPNTNDRLPNRTNRYFTVQYSLFRTRR